MNKVSLTTENTNNKLIINHPIVAESMEIINLNLTNDIYINGAEYTPVGSLLTYAGTTAPNGWLFCNGSEVNKTTYSRIMNCEIYLLANFAIFYIYLHFVSK